MITPFLVRDILNQVKAEFGRHVAEAIIHVRGNAKTIAEIPEEQYDCVVDCAKGLLFGRELATEVAL